MTAEAVQTLTDAALIEASEPDAATKYTSSPMALTSQGLSRRQVAALRLAFGSLYPTIVNEVGLPDDLPSSILLGTLDRPTVRVTQAIPLKVTREDGTIAVAWEDLNEFGYAENLSDAIRDFQRNVAELFIELETDCDRLGPALRDSLDKLRGFLRLDEPLAPITQGP